MSDPMEAIRDILGMPEDELQAAGDELRDQRDTEWRPNPEDLA